MSGGGHYGWNQGIDAEQWKATVKTVIARLRGQTQLRFLCHNMKEYELAAELEPDIPRLFPRTPQEYFQTLSRVRIALVNRLHAAVALAGIGIPSLAVGTDTRLLMVEATGLPFEYVKKATPEVVLGHLGRLLSNWQAERDRLLGLRQFVWNRYVEIVRAVLSVG
jgi:hypothetical protein